MKKTSNKRQSRPAPLALQLLRFFYNTLGRLFPNYFGRRAYELWFTTTRFKTPTRELQALDSAGRETIEVNGLQIAVYIWQHETIEAAATLLFIHGWAGRGSQVASYIEKLNHAGYRVISFDAPAHGRTAGRQTSMLEVTDVVFALDKKYGNFDAAITHSFGGMVLTFAISRGLAIKRAVLICPPCSFNIILENFQRTLHLPDNVMQVMIRKTYATYGQITRDMVDVATNASKLSCPALLIHDTDDTEIPWRSSEKIAQAWPGAKLFKTEGLGHHRILRDDQVVQHVLTFLETDRT